MTDPSTITAARHRLGAIGAWARQATAAVQAKACAVAVAGFAALAAAAAPAAPASPAGASAGDTVVAAPLVAGERIVLDGSLSHPAWKRAPAHSRFVERDPRPGAEPPQLTRVQVLFDQQALYIGVTVLDTAMDQLRDVPVRYDGVNRTQDFVVAYVDAIGTKAAAQFFRVNAAGSLADGIHTASDDSEDFSPDFDWDAAVQRGTDGWTAVMRIPFASLRFAEPQAGQAQQTWRFMLARRLPRQHFHLITSVDIPRDAPSFIDRLQPLAGVALPDQHRFLVIRPSLTLRATDERAAGLQRARENHIEGSLDIKWRPRAELVIDGTLKPDFSQVALDVPQLTGNSRFALFLPEKRPFFFESADLLRSPTDALYTRSFTQPRGGLRATWRSPTWSGTAMALDDLGGGLVLLPGAYGTDAAAQPGSVALAGRVRLEQGPWQWGGLLAARRYDQGRGDNAVAGPDIDGPLSAQWRIRAQWLLSQSSALPQSGELVRGPARHGHRLYARAQRLVPDGETVIEFNDTHADFRHDSGFVNQAGVRSAMLFHAHKWQGVGPFNFFDLNIEAREVRHRDTGELVEQVLRPGWWAAGASNLEWWFEAYPLARLRTGPGAPLLEQRYVASGLVWTPAPWFPLVDTRLIVGDLADTVANRVRPGAQWRLNTRLRPWRSIEFEPSVSQAWLVRRDAGVRQLVYHEVAAQAVVVWHIDAQHHLRLIAQRSSLSRAAEPGVSAQHSGSRAESLTYTWRRSAGTRLYVGVSQAGDRRPGTDRQREAFVKLQVDADEWRSLW